MAASGCGIMCGMLRSKNFLILLLFFVAASIAVWLVTIPTPDIRSIMAKTHKHINSIKNMEVIGQHPPEKKHDPTEVHKAYLELLGFTDHSHLYVMRSEVSSGVGRETTAIPDQLPTIVSGVSSSNYHNAIHLINSVQRYLTSQEVMIFDLGLGSYDLVQLKKHCNHRTHCHIRSFDFDKFPHHLKDTHMQAFRPIAIQMALNDYGSVIWTDSSESFITDNISSVLQQAHSTGITAWTIKSREPTSALTHPTMFQYFHTKQENYYFQHMVSSDHLVLYNTARIHKHLMLPWVRCALSTECMWPRGAQNTGCRRNRKPLYRYSGCHRCSTSALNVILGLMFDYNEESYTSYHEVFGIDTMQEDMANMTEH